MKARPGNTRHSNSAMKTVATGWAAGHARCCVEALGRLRRGWIASALTVLVIGITLALPAGLYVTVKNLNGLTYSWQTSVQVSLYLHKSVSDNSARQIAQRISGYDLVGATDYISPAEGLATIRSADGFGAALDALPGNPLPGVIAVTPKTDLSQAQMTKLLAQLRQLPSVDRAELDQAWLQRLNAILTVLERSAWVIGLLLAAAVIFIVGNTIRLDIESRREEIEVMKLIGANDAFIRRPFLYSGVWYGLLGAVVALLVLAICLLALADPLGALTRSYAGALTFSGLGWAGTLWLLVAGTTLGWGGCALTVNRRLRAIEPR